MMDFYGIVRQVLEQLQRDGRTTYRALKRQFNLNDDALEDLKEELLFAHPVVEEDGRGLVWTGVEAPSEPDAQHETGAESRFHLLLPDVTARLQQEERITYRRLKFIYGVDDVLLENLRKELTFQQVARDEQGEGLVWTGKPQPLTELTSTIANPAIVALPSTREPDTGYDQSAIRAEPTRNTPEAERRQLTVMFCDLADSTKLSQQLDPEDLREVIRSYQSAATEVVHQYEGHVAQYLGDGLLIYFGWPQAHEDDAQRALYAGLGIIDAMVTLNGRLEEEKRVKLTVRLGVHTGPVVVGEMGGGGRHENLATGETVNIAARLEGLAAPNTVVVSGVTERLVQRAFALEDLGSQVLKGVAGPIPAFRVLGPMADAEDELATVGMPFLVGRDEEVGLLLRRWEQTKESLGQVVLISGEAGIGKSSLVATVRRHVGQDDHTHMVFRCSPYHTNSALYPIIEFVQRVLQVEEGDTPETRLDKLECVLGDYSRPLDEVLPLYAALLSVPLPEGRYPPLNMTPQQQRQQTQDALVGWLLEEAERCPTLVMWEDLHWADPSTLEMLGLVLEQTPTVPMLHILTFRPEFEPPWPNRSHMTPVTLNRLERAQVEALIMHLSRGKALPPEVVEHIITKTDGVPLYVEELTKMLLASEMLREEANHYLLTGPLSTVAIPDTLQDSLMARLDQMDNAKEIAQLGAVVGRTFSYEMVQAISSQDDVTIQASLAQLVEAELLYQRGRPPRATYLFKHALIQDAAYASLLKSTRQRIHLQIANLFEANFPERVATQPELVAHHCTEAGLNEQAISYWQRAGQRALQRSAHVEAISHLTRGLALLAALPETQAHLQQELDLQIALGPSLIATKGQAAPEVERTYTRARELSQLIGDTVQLFPALRGLLVHYLVGGQLQMGSELGEQLLRLAQSQSEPELLLLAYNTLGTVLFWRGEPVAAHDHHTQALAIYTPQEHQALSLRYGLDIGVSSHSFLGWDLWHLGYPDQALQHSREAHTVAEEISHPYSLAMALLFAAVFHQFRRETVAAYELTAAATSRSTEQGFVLFLALGAVLHGWARAMQGQSEAGIAEIRQGLAANLATGAKVFQPYILGLLSEACGEGGHPEEGLNALAEALAVMETTEARFHEAEIHRLKGALLLKKTSPDRKLAEASFCDALNIARRQQARSWELRAATSLARLWQSQDKRQDAYDLLAPVYGWFTEGFDTADLQDAKGLLQELER